MYAKYGLFIIEDHLLSTLVQIYSAGTDTTSCTLYWAFLYMVVHPEVQQAIYQEIEDTIGKQEECCQCSFQLQRFYKQKTCFFTNAIADCVCWYEKRLIL